MCGEEVKRGMHTFEFLLAIYCDTAMPCGYHVDAITSSSSRSSRVVEDVSNRASRHWSGQILGEKY